MRPPKKVAFGNATERGARERDSKENQRRHKNHRRKRLRLFMETTGEMCLWSLFQERREGVRRKQLGKAPQKKEKQLVSTTKHFAVKR